jgi:hypothetical protein
MTLKQALERNQNYESGGQRFESFRARHQSIHLRAIFGTDRLVTAFRFSIVGFYSPVFAAKSHPIDQLPMGPSAVDLKFVTLHAASPKTNFKSKTALES